MASQLSGALPHEPGLREIRELSGSFLSDIYRVDTGWLDLYIPEEDQPRVRAEIQAARAAKMMFELEHRVHRLDGTIGWTHSRTIPILNGQGYIVEWFGSASDMTVRKSIEDALRESEARQRALMEGVPQLVWRAVDGGDWKWASPQWSAYTGLSEAESLGHGWLDALHLNDRDETVKRWNEAERSGAFEFEYRLCHAAEQRYRWFQNRATPVHDERGRIIERLGTSTDVNDLRQMQASQAILVAELQHRTRNLLSVVRSIAAQTVAGAVLLLAFQAVFSNRLAALARVQGLLSRSDDDPDHHGGSHFLGTRRAERRVSSRPHFDRRTGGAPPETNGADLRAGFVRAGHERAQVRSTGDRTRFAARHLAHRRHESDGVGLGGGGTHAGTRDIRFRASTPR